MAQTRTQQPDSVARVNYWHIPGGANYTNARLVDVFFNDMAEAEAFAAKYDNPPEMAFLIPIAPCPSN